MKTVPAHLSLARGLQPDLLAVDPMLHADSNASARNAYGVAAQVIVCEALRLRAIRINGNFGVCFDAEDDDHFYEIKSCHAGAKVVIYHWRLEKELAQDVPLKYAILIHRLRGARLDVLAQLRAKAKQILVLPVAEVSRVFERHVTRFTVRKQHMTGYTRPGYDRGYRNLPLVELMASPQTQIIPLSQ
jgi:hypothetical protein